MQHAPSANGRSLVDGDVVAGVLSGTSADGIDVALVRIRLDGPSRVGSIEPIHGETAPFPGDLGPRVQGLLGGEQMALADLARLHRDLGTAFGAAARAAADRASVPRLALVASHGQTVFHHDGDPAAIGATLQLGDGDHVAEAAGCAAATDFRMRDCAAGGEGAPLVALVDDVLFAKAPRPLAILNLGGIANWTVLLGDAPALAADTGPAGALLDGLARRRLGAPYDAGGAVAARGEADERLIARILDHPFLARSWPKSTGRDTFDAAYLDRVVAAGERLSDADLLASAAVAVARSAAEGLVSAPWPSGGSAAGLEVAIAGGGVHNRALRAALEEELSRALPRARAGMTLAGVHASDRFGVSVDGREALAFAVLGARLVIGEPSTSPAATRALGGRVLGKWSPPVV